MQINPAVQKLSQLFVNNIRFQVPPFQRDYKWRDTEELQELWDDLSASYENDQEHFLGTIVLSNAGDRNKMDVVDGQQRLTTVSLLFHTIYATAEAFLEDPNAPIFEKINESEKNEESASNVVTQASSLLWDRRKENKYLSLNEKDNGCYKDILEGGLPERKPSANQSRLLKARWGFWEKIQETFLSGPGSCEKYDGTFKAIEDFVFFISDNLQFLKLEATTSDVDAYILFESLNDRGQPLDPADLLKNGLLKFCGGSNDKEAEVLQNWKTIENNLSSSRFSITDYVRFYWSAFHKETTNQKLYKEIKGYLQNGKCPVSLSRLLSENSNFFSKITQKKQWPSQASNFTKEYFFEDINYLNYKICYPLFLKANSLDIDYMDKLVGGTLKFLFRMITVQERSVGLASRTMSQMIDALRDGKPKEDVLAILINDTEYKDEHFTRSLIEREFEPQIARYILFNIDLKEQGSVRGARFDEVHVEHIYPQNPSTDWNDFDCRGMPEDHWKYNLGNQTLLDKQLNQNASNKSFPDKIIYYKKKDGACGAGESEEGTVFDMTFELHDAYQSGETEWTNQRILERAQSLAQQATQIW